MAAHKRADADRFGSRVTPARLKTPTEAVAMAKALEPFEKKAAKERQEASRAKEGERIGGENFTPPMPTESGKSRDKIAEAVGMSRP